MFLDYEITVIIKNESVKLYIGFDYISPMLSCKVANIYRDMSIDSDGCKGKLKFSVECSKLEGANFSFSIKQLTLDEFQSLILMDESIDTSNNTTYTTDTTDTFTTYPYRHQDFSNMISRIWSA